MARLTKKTALAIFKEELNIMIANGTFGKKDKIAFNEAWGVFIDSLCKDNKISQQQYNNWHNPF
tara:strand:- start:246 stop:437 length:192 start_codon:yes stop_codon:yes gene_type:complete